MDRLIARLLGMVFAAAVLAAPAAADLPIPRDYPARVEGRSAPAIADDIALRESAAADAAEAACDSGDPAGCAVIGDAYAFGRGRARNRPVAELLYREACDGAQAAGCLGLGRLLRSVDPRQDWPESAQLFARGCRLGLAEACDAEADDLQYGILGAPDPDAADALRRATCAAGSAATCHIHAIELMQQDRSASEQAEGRTLLDRACRAGEANACMDAAKVWQTIEQGIGPRTRSFQERACTGGAAEGCRTLGLAALAQGPAAHAAAVVYFARACALAASVCADAEAVRDEPLLTARCEAQDQGACLALGHLLANGTSPLYDRARALALLGTACEAGIGEACVPAAHMAFAELFETGMFQPERADAYFTRACEGGDSYACQRLADELAGGDRIPGDGARAAMLYLPQCEEGRAIACEFLARWAQEDPAAVLLPASGEYAPELTPAELAAQMRAQRAEEEAVQREKEQREAARCETVSTVFRGVTYTDTRCNPPGVRMRNAFTARIGAAPWQALIWRPAQVARGRRASLEQRVLCGGAVIREGWLLTAAHCLRDDAAGPIISAGHSVRLGVYNPLDENEGFTYPILKVVAHPDYTRAGFAFDIALVQYDLRRGKRGHTVYPITRVLTDPQPITTRAIRTGTPAYAFGWGRTEVVGGEAPDRLRGARLELRDTQTCTGVTNFTDHRRDAALCAVGRRDEQACYGDSGGPLLTYDGPRGAPVVIGIISSGVKCGTTGKLSRFTRVAHQRVQEWLAQNLPGYQPTSTPTASLRPASR